MSNLDFGWLIASLRWAVIKDNDDMVWWVYYHFRKSSTLEEAQRERL